MQASHGRAPREYGADGVAPKHPILRPTIGGISAQPRSRATRDLYCFGPAQCRHTSRRLHAAIKSVRQNGPQPVGQMRDQMGRVSSGSAGRRCGISSKMLATGHSAASTKPSIR